MLPALGRIGGQQSLVVIHEAIQDRDSQVRDAAVHALADWPDASVADELLQLARTAEQPTYRIWTLRRFARVVAREGQEQPQKTSEQLREAMQLAQRREEKQLILQRLTAARVPDSLTLALACIEDQQLQADAIDSTVSLAEAMKDSYPAEARAALERIQQVILRPGTPALHCQAAVEHAAQREVSTSASVPFRQAGHVDVDVLAVVLPRQSDQRNRCGPEKARCRIRSRESTRRLGCEAAAFRVHSTSAEVRRRRSAGKSRRAPCSSASRIASP